jgi:uncharacterized protein
MGAPFVWFDLTEADGRQVAAFYRDLLGWAAEPGPGGYQDWFLDGGQPWAGTIGAAGVPAGRWVPYVPVDGLDAAVTKAVEMGGAVVRDKVTGPAGTSVIISDPGGALVALFAPAAG